MSSPRDEAERFVAAALAAASVAARTAGGFATGSAECCVCPVCRAIAAVRDPDPALAERLAASAGDVAAGLAGVLRAFGTAASPPQPRREEPAATGDDADVWREATTVADTASAPPKAAPPPKPMAKKAVKRALNTDE
jgi:hypothetical protein